MRWLLTIVAVISILTASGCSRSKEGRNYVPVSSDDAAMNAAIAKAKATSGEFIRALHEKKAGTKGFYVKKPYPTPSGGVEHVWIEVSAESNGILNGSVANQAEETRMSGSRLSLLRIKERAFIEGRTFSRLWILSGQDPRQPADGQPWAALRKLFEVRAWGLLICDSDDYARGGLLIGDKKRGQG